MNSNIFQIQNEYLSLMNELEELEGELTPELEEKLKVNAEDFARKFDAYVAVIKQKTADIGLIKDEVQRLNGLSKQSQNLIDKLKTVLLKSMQTLGFYGKTGNLAYETKFNKAYSRDTESVEVYDIKDIDENLVSDYIDLVDYEVTFKCNHEQVEILHKFLVEQPAIDNKVKASINKDRFKAKYEEYKAEIDDNDEVPERLAELDLLGRLFTKTSLTIK